MIDEIGHAYRTELLLKKGSKAYLRQINTDVARTLERLQFRIDEAAQNRFKVACSFEQATNRLYVVVSELNQG